MVPNGRIKIIALSILSFYRSYVLAGLLIDGICVEILKEYGWKSFFGIFWLKIFSLSMTFVLINDRKKSEFFYYYNLGLTRTFLWIASLSLDLISFFVLLKLIKI